MRLFPLCVWLAHVASIAGAPWGNYDGNGGLTDGHYCADNALSPPTTYDFSRGYWFGLTWASTAPSAGVFNFSGLDAALARADATNQYVEANALVGQCSPAWLYSKAVGVEPLIVSWKPPPTCVPPLCVPAGTWNCSSNNGQGCGCDGRYPCNQTFPDYLSPIYQTHQKAWAQALHDHVQDLPRNLFDRLLSVQVNAGSTGDGCAWHGRLYPDQRLAGYNKIENKTVYNAFSLSVHKMWISIFGTTSAERAIPLLFNGLGSASLPGLQEAVNASVRAGMMPRGYMIKVGGPSHLYSESGEMETYNTIAPLMRTPLSPGVYVRSRGESTLSASTSWMTNAGWTAWALSGFSLAYGADTWQNNTLIEEQPRLWPALATFSRYAGW
eukprot:gene21936-3522_t